MFYIHANGGFKKDFCSTCLIDLQIFPLYTDKCICSLYKDFIQIPSKYM